MLPGKTAEDVRQRSEGIMDSTCSGQPEIHRLGPYLIIRYAKLVLDITRINNGDEIVIHYEGPLNDSFQGKVRNSTCFLTRITFFLPT